MVKTTGKYIAVDIETTGLIDQHQMPEILSIALYNDIYQDALDWQTGKQEFITFLEDGYEPIYHNASFDHRVLTHALGFDWKYNDTMALAKLHNNQEKVSLKECALRYLKDTEKLEFDTKHITKVTPELLEYNLQDTKVTWELWKHLTSRTSESQWEQYILEMEYSAILIEQANNGVLLDASRIAELAEIANKEAEQLATIINKAGAGLIYKEKFYKTLHPELGVPFPSVKEDFQYMYKVPAEFNLNSDAHLAEALYNLGWRPTEFTKTGKPKLAKDVVKKIQKDTTQPEAVRELAAVIAEYKALYKTREFILKTGKFTDSGKYPGYIHISPSFKQYAVVTGRLSCTNPNVQQMPAGRTGFKTTDELAQGYRGCFIPFPGEKLIVADYSAIEARIMASLAYKLGAPEAAEVYLEAERLKQEGYDEKYIKKHADFHTLNAQALDVSRSNAKTILYAYSYGGTAYRFSSALGISMEEAEGIERRIGEKLPYLSKVKEYIIKTTINQGYIQFIGGRKWRPQKELWSFGWRSAAAIRQLMNAYFQGSAAYIIKYHTIKMMPMLRKYNAKLMMQVHDEIVLSVPAENAMIVATEMERIARENNLINPVPCVLEPVVGNDWSIK